MVLFSLVVELDFLQFYLTLKLRLVYKERWFRSSQLGKPIAKLCGVLLFTQAVEQMLKGNEWHFGFDYLYEHDVNHHLFCFLLLLFCPEHLRRVFIVMLILFLLLIIAHCFFRASASIVLLHLPAQ